MITETCDANHLPYGAGTGIASDPYEICSVPQFDNIRLAISASYQLMVDLDLTTYPYPAFSPIANSGQPFTGTLNGNGHTISNWTASSSTSSLALFGDLAQNAIIENINLSNFSISSISESAVLALNTDSSALITSVHATGNLVAPGGGYGALAGLVFAFGGQMTRSSFTGSITDTIDTNCDYIGGLVGILSGTISNSWVQATINGPACSLVGGLVGEGLGGSVSQSFMSGSVSGGIEVGGLVGLLGGTNLSDSYSTSTVAGYQAVGGITGWGAIGNVNRVYAVGAVSGTTSVGGITGEAPSTNSFSNSYWDIIQTGQSTDGASSGTTGCTLAGCPAPNGQTMFMQSTYSGWNFNNIWYPPTATTYPTLR